MCEADPIHRDPRSTVGHRQDNDLATLPTRGESYRRSFRIPCGSSAKAWICLPYHSHSSLALAHIITLVLWNSERPLVCLISMLCAETEQHTVSAARIILRGNCRSDSIHDRPIMIDGGSYFGYYGLFAASLGCTAVQCSAVASASCASLQQHYPSLFPGTGRAPANARLYGSLVNT